MEMHQIRYVLAVCRTCNFTRAARRCGVSQPSLTKAVKALELELGGRLFHRDRRGVRMTGMGARLRPYFEEIARLVTTIQEDVAEHAALNPAAALAPQNLVSPGADLPAANGAAAPVVPGDGLEVLNQVPAE